jgi:hypothetical protein
MLDNGIYVFLLVIIALGVVYYIKPLEALFIYLSGTYIFYVVVGLETNDFDVLLNARVNGLSFALIGLGLLLCKELMQKLGGKIEVKSEENIGTTFYIYFPKV